MDPHAPYDPPAPYHPGDPSTDRQRYLGEVRFLDDQLRLLYCRFAEAGLMENTIFLLVADHGEEFGEHGGTGHGQTLYTEVLHVPLILHGEGLTPHLGRKKPGRVIGQQVRLIDVAPTLLDAAGVDRIAYRDMEGESLLPLITAWFPSHRPAYSQLGLNFDRTDLDSYFDRFALSTKKGKLIVDRAADGTEYFRVRKDPAEQADLAGDPGWAMKRLKRRLDSYIAQAPPPPSAGGEEELDQRNLDQLRALGYITD
jgi:arylsulfatase A-like enzyme